MTKRSPRKKAPAPIEWTERAMADLRAIDDYIAADNPEAAVRWIGKILARAEKASRTPLAGRIVPEKGRAEIREVILGTYRIVYGVRARGIVILTVFEGHRLLPSDAINVREE